ncbi:MAG TPA: hypothetical protein VF486_25510, partial [Actinomycetes bacterium]
LDDLVVIDHQDTGIGHIGHGACTGWMVGDAGLPEHSTARSPADSAARRFQGRPQIAAHPWETASPWCTIRA